MSFSFLLISINVAFYTLDIVHYRGNAGKKTQSVMSSWGLLASLMFALWSLCHVLLII